MTGRKRLPGADIRDERTTVRWTKNELARLEKARELLDIAYTADIIRLLTLRQLEVIESAHARILTK